MRSALRLIKITLCLIVATLLLRGLFDAISAPDFTSQYYTFIKEDLSKPGFSGYTSRQVLREQPFQIVALSDMAIGLMNSDKRKIVAREELLPLIDEVRRRALSPAVSTYTPLTPETDFTTGGIDGLYLSHTNLILGIHQYLHASTTPEALHTAITKTLHDRSLAESDSHVPSFRFGDKWPADQAVTLLSLYVYDQVNGTAYADESIKKWLSYMNTQMIDAETGLYKSAIAERWYKDIPRGTAHSWMIFYMAQFAPVEAEKLYGLYRTEMWREFLGIGGFREWPSGRDGHMNIDTGPIVLDIGSAATALGLGPTRLFQDEHHSAMIMRLFSLLGIPHYSPLIGKAILFSGQTAVLWFGDYTPTGYEQTPASPLLFYVLYLSAGVVLCTLILFADTFLARFLRKITKTNRTIISA